jgi:O-succinylbenzoate synthase
MSTLANFSLPGDVSASKRYWKEDIIEPEVEVNREGFIDAETKYRVRDGVVERATVKRETINAIRRS